MIDPNWVRGYHGTSVDNAQIILREGFKISRNEYDWLGDGVYFFQDAPMRAAQWANELFGPEAAVVAVRIELVDCMDLLDIAWGRLLADSYDAFLRHLKSAGLPMPRQTTGAHRLDREVINYTLGLLEERHGQKVRSVRASFAEGRPVFANSALLDKSHVQIAVRDLSAIHDPNVL
jgi:hypothetical protein